MSLDRCGMPTAMTGYPTPISCSSSYCKARAKSVKVTEQPINGQTPLRLSKPSEALKVTHGIVRKSAP